MTSVFLAHSSADKPFVRRLAADLLARGVEVWFDEAELLVGDSLIERIQHGIKNTEYFGVVLSRSAVESAWVKREVEAALATEIAADRIKVLPILFEDCEIPQFLTAKLYADFRTTEGYARALASLLRRLQPASPDSGSLFFSKWTPELARVGVLIGLLETREGEIVVADRVLEASSNNARKWARGEMELAAPGEIVLRAMLEAAKAEGHSALPLTIEEIKNLHNEIQMQVLDIITNEALRIGLLKRSEDVLLVPEEVINLLIDLTTDFANLIVSGQLNLDRFWIAALSHEARTRLIVHKSSLVSLNYNFALLLFTILESKEIYLVLKRIAQGTRGSEPDA
jgi:TIR domain-containing protein